jgi:hypothetical protein
MPVLLDIASLFEERHKPMHQVRGFVSKAARLQLVAGTGVCGKAVAGPCGLTGCVGSRDVPVGSLGTVKGDIPAGAWTSRMVEVGLLSMRSLVPGVRVGLMLEPSGSFMTVGGVMRRASAVDTAASRMAMAATVRFMEAS